MIYNYYTLSGPNGFSASWSLLVGLVPAESTPNEFFATSPQTITVNGVAYSGTIAFFNILEFGGLDLNIVDFLSLSLEGPQLYTGTETVPVLTVGTFTLTGVGSYSLTVIAKMSCVPFGARSPEIMVSAAGGGVETLISDGLQVLQSPSQISGTIAGCPIPSINLRDAQQNKIVNPA